MAASPMTRALLDRRRAMGALVAVATAACCKRDSVSSAPPTDAGDAADVPATPAPRDASVTADVALELVTMLRAQVARSNGYGGGLMRIEGSDGVLWEGAAGELAHGAPEAIAAGDAFEVASVTKTFTAACVLQLAEEGRLRLDDELGTLLPGAITTRLLVIAGEDLGPRVTVRQLLSHRSGLADVWTDPPFPKKRGENAFVRDFMLAPHRRWKAEEVLAYARDLSPIARPGERYRYSDTGYLLLGLLIEHLTERELHLVFRARFGEPLGLHATYLSYRETPPAPGREAHRYEEKLDLHGQERQSADWASGGLVSSAPDLARFLRALARGALFRDPSSLREMSTFRPTGEGGIDYGLGLFRAQLPRGLGELWGHDGHGNAFMYHWPARGISWVGTLNQTKNDWWTLVSKSAELLSRRM